MQIESINAAVVQAVRTYEFNIHTGEGAWRLLGKEAFLNEWDALYETCPWATVFQSRPFVTAWYHTYREVCFPVLLTQYEGGRLTGLLTLTRKQKGLLTGAGESQAEYQVWLATEAASDAFIKKALFEIDKHWPGVKTIIKYIPGNTPMKWLGEEGALSRRCVLNEVQQPLLKIDTAHLEKELKKKNRKEKLNRLKRIGDTKLERITDAAVFASILDELALQYDFRKLVMHNRVFFLDDPLRKKFLLSLFEQGLLHTTVLKVNEEIIASNVGATGKGWVHLQGVNTHAPTHAKYSPGILHFLLMGKLMAEEGIAIFDLTPGSEPYKDQLATDYTLAYVLHIGSPLSRVMKRINRVLVEQVKKVAQGKRSKPGVLLENKKRVSRMKDKIKHLLKQPPSFYLKNAVGAIRKKPLERQYVVDVDRLVLTANGVSIQRNSIRDLLYYETKGAEKTRWEFLEEAMLRFEAGQVLYSFSKDGRLLCSVWLKEQQGTTSPVLQGFYCPQAGQSWLPSFLQAVIQTIALQFQTSRLYAQTQDSMIGKALEVVGFKETDGMELS